MSRHKYTNLFCYIIVIAAFVFTSILVIISNGKAEETGSNQLGYETRLFDTSKVHSIDIVINDSDWNAIQENAIEKNYVPCDVIIDGEVYSNVGIRAKGNYSLMQVAMTECNRYSFKIDFAQYQDNKRYYGLDELALNNIIQDNTYMKDYLCYTMMRDMGVDSPLCSYIDVSVNGKAFGLYLAVEGIGESFVQRNYGNTNQHIYKPESVDMGNILGADREKSGLGKNNGFPDLREIMEVQKSGVSDEENKDSKENASEEKNNAQGGIGFSQNDIALKYSDDKIESYSNIFNGALFDVNNADKKRLIASIKQMNQGEQLEDVVDIDKVLRYFVVHNFVDNFDSYTGAILHNYCLRENDGKLSMIPWDYNLAFGSFSVELLMEKENGTSEEKKEDNLEKNYATEMVNFPIDTPVSAADIKDRPLLNVLLSQEKYLKQYHSLFDEFLTKYLENGTYKQLIEETNELIHSYVENDVTAFCNYREYQEGVDTLEQFIDLRTKSIRGQVDGTIPATTEGQKDSKKLVDASGISIESMGNSIMPSTENGQSESGKQSEAKDTMGQGKEKKPENEFIQEKMKQIEKVFGSNATTAEQKKVQYTWLAASFVILLLGFLFVKFYGRRR